MQLIKWSLSNWNSIKFINPALAPSLSPPLPHHLHHYHFLDLEVFVFILTYFEAHMWPWSMNNVFINCVTLVSKIFFGERTLSAHMYEGTLCYCYRSCCRRFGSCQSLYPKESWECYVQHLQRQHNGCLCVWVLRYALIKAQYTCTCACACACSHTLKAIHHIIRSV